jgi:uncharacterized membrane protein (Fun14 family)
MLKVDGVEIGLGFIVGLALGYYAFKHWAQNGKAV